MKKTFKAVFITVFVLSIAILTLGSCDFDISSLLGEYVCVHEWSEWDIVEQGDCKNPSLIRRECTKCGAIDESTTSLNTHIESEWIVDKEATCVEDGSKHTECTVCGITISTETITAILTEHKYENYNCVNCGLTSEECFEFTYLPESDSYSIKAKNVNSMPSKVIIPSTYNGKDITSIGYEAFYRCSNLTSIEMPTSVTSIGYYAFAFCFSLTRVVIPDSVTSIGNDAFYNCSSLTSVVIPDSVTSIGGYAFYGCKSLSSVVIPDSVTYIGSYAFHDCKSLTSVVIGDSVTYIGGYAFGYCDSLKSIEVNENNQNFKSIDGNLYTKDGKSLIRYAISKEDTSFIIPDNVTSIGDGAFSGCKSLSNVVMPDSLTIIGDFAFSGCKSLTSLVIPDSVTYIGDWAFEGYKNITSVVIGKSVTYIGYYAFLRWESLTDVYYTGTEEEWANITIDNSYNGNDYLLNATIHYNYVPEN